MPARRNWAALATTTCPEISRRAQRASFRAVTLPITEVCRRAGVSAPSIYARVDGKAGLFRAAHEQWLLQIEKTERVLTAEHVRQGDSLTDAAAAAALVIMGVFDAHSRALRALVTRSTHDDELLARGGAASRSLLDRLAATIPAPPERAEAALRAVYAECVMRLLYGSQFLVSGPESDAQFRERVTALARLISGASAADPVSHPPDSRPGGYRGATTTQ